MNRPARRYQYQADLLSVDRSAVCDRLLSASNSLCVVLRDDRLGVGIAASVRAGRLTGSMTPDPRRLGELRWSPPGPTRCSPECTCRTNQPASCMSSASSSTPRPWQRSPRTSSGAPRHGDEDTDMGLEAGILLALRRPSSRRRGLGGHAGPGSHAGRRSGIFAGGTTYRRYPQSGAGRRFPGVEAILEAIGCAGITIPL